MLPPLYQSLDLSSLYHHNLYESTAIIRTREKPISHGNFIAFQTHLNGVHYFHYKFRKRDINAIKTRKQFDFLYKNITKRIMTNKEFKKLFKDTDANANNEDKNTPLHEAAKKGNTVEARHLIEQGTDVTAKNELEETPLHLAAQYGNIEIVKILVEKDSVSVNVPDGYGETALHWAAKKGNTEVARYLIKNGADVNAKNALGDTPLHLASQYGNIEIVEILIENGAKVNVQNRYGESPSYLAAQYENIEIVKILVGNGTEVDQPDTSVKKVQTTKVGPDLSNQPPL